MFRSQGKSPSMLVHTDVLLFPRSSPRVFFGRDAVFLARVRQDCFDLSRVRDCRAVLIFGCMFSVEYSTWQCLGPISISSLEQPRTGGLPAIFLPVGF